MIEGIAARINAMIIPEPIDTSDCICIAEIKSPPPITPVTMVATTSFNPSSLLNSANFSPPIRRFQRSIFVLI